MINVRLGCCDYWLRSLRDLNFRLWHSFTYLFLLFPLILHTLEKSDWISFLSFKLFLDRLFQGRYLLVSIVDLERLAFDLSCLRSYLPNLVCCDIFLNCFRKIDKFKMRVLRDPRNWLNVDHLTLHLSIHNKLLTFKRLECLFYLFLSYNCSCLILCARNRRFSSLRSFMNDHLSSRTWPWFGSCRSLKVRVLGLHSKSELPLISRIYSLIRSSRSSKASGCLLISFLGRALLFRLNLSNIILRSSVCMLLDIHKLTLVFLSYLLFTRLYR